MAMYALLSIFLILLLARLIGQGPEGGAPAHAPATLSGGEA
jgi:hypothetical protein